MFVLQMYGFLGLFFFFKQKTAYEMRISDWSSDVCSSDLILHRLGAAFDPLPPRCREVVWLRRVEDLPQKEVAARLGISQTTVEMQVSKGDRPLAAHFYGPGTPPGTARTVAHEADNRREGNECYRACNTTCAAHPSK